VILIALLAALGGCKAPKAESINVLIFSRTAGFRHDSIPAGVKAMHQVCFEAGYSCVSTEDASLFTADNLAQFRVVVFLNTTGDILDDAQQRAFEQWFNAGKCGFFGIHSAADTEYDWPFYSELLGGQFKSHPEVQPAIVVREDATHPSTSFLIRDHWQRTDEWYNYRTNPRQSSAHVLLSLDTASYNGSEMQGDHPIAWCRERGTSRMIYTGGGHTIECFSEDLFLQHLNGALRWAAHDAERMSPKS